MKHFLFVILSLFIVISCKKEEQTPTAKKTTDSIFYLDSQWKNQDGKTIQLKDLKGKNLAIVMIFTSCKTSCPLLVADMKKVYDKLDKNKIKDTNLVLISIDPANDTPEVLKKFAEERKMYGEPWTFLVSDDESIREFANVLAVKYKQISPIEFSHSNLISIFNKNGEMVNQQEGAGVNSESVAKILNELK
ncbi:SCO family protein [Candidatus Kaistella beijingensis]|uniref:SCO family protein n=1 Tax=Candidatus Kaistella beijingensis TaxID=2820270 RepID=UPI001CC51376|nr:SCO family protein [Candidatus Kaistella beijingensis]UBB89447.1 SCO family protein [Candidatus Kaistella beijingensis]